MAGKSKEREILQQLVKEFLERGGEIQVIPEGKRGKCLPKEPPLTVLKQPTGARCLICDWSPTDSRSVMHPEIEECGGNKLVIDDLTGDMLCLVCLAAAARMNYDFKIAQNPSHGQSKYLLSKEAKEFLRSESYFGEFQGKRQIYDPVLGRLSEGSKQKGQAAETDS